MVERTAMADIHSQASRPVGLYISTQAHFFTLPEPPLPFGTETMN
jgi:hypothetical protein